MKAAGDSDIDHLSDGVEVQLGPEDRVALRHRVPFSGHQEDQLLELVDGEVLADDVAQFPLENHPLKLNKRVRHFFTFCWELN